MAGADPAGRSWAAAYDDAAAVTLGVTSDVVNGCYQLAALLQQSGFNYGRAESHSTPGGLGPLPDRTAYGGWWLSLAVPPSAAGGSVPVPPQWAVIEHAVGYVWPGGHQDSLHAAAAAWTAAATAIADSTVFVYEALECISVQLTPEVDDAMTACRAMDAHLGELVATYRSMAGACSQFARHIDKAHSDAEGELISLLEWTAGLQVAGGVFAFFTAGISEIPAQLMQADRIAATAAKVRAIIVHLIDMARLVAESISTTTARIVEVSRDLKALLGTRLSVATMEKAAQLPDVLATTENLAVTGLQVSTTLDLALVPEGKRALVIDTVARAKSRVISFTGHDGKDFMNRDNALPARNDYTEWTVAEADAVRGTDRIIIAGDVTHPDAIYYWDHVNKPLQIGP